MGRWLGGEIGLMDRWMNIKMMDIRIVGWTDKLVYGVNKDR